MTCPDHLVLGKLSHSTWVHPAELVWAPVSATTLHPQIVTQMKSLYPELVAPKLLHVINYDADIGIDPWLGLQLFFQELGWTH